MIANRVDTTRPRPRVALAAALTLALAGATGAPAVHAAPVKLVLASHFGHEVNLTEVQAHAGAALEDVCTVASKDTCQPGRESAQPDGFSDPEGVAGAANGNIYIADVLNDRVQELTSTGEFVLMFGKHVNQSTGGDVCTEEEIKNTGVRCQAGQAGSEAGAITYPHAIAVDPTTGNVYVFEYGGFTRVDEYTATGQFVLMIGREVDRTKDETPGATPAEKNLCTAASGDTCTKSTVGNGEPGTFNYHQAPLAAGGPEGLLYVGDEHRVQEFAATGQFKRELSLTAISSEPESTVGALAVDPAGDTYLVYDVHYEAGVLLEHGRDNVVREFDPGGTQIGELTVAPREASSAGAKVTVFIDLGGLALDSSGRLAVAATEQIQWSSKPFGLLYDAATGRLITRWAAPVGGGGVAFNGGGELFDPVSGIAGQEIVAYSPVPVAELVKDPVVCVAGADHATNATLDCALKGEANPEGVAETSVWFQWGRTEALGEETPRQPVATGKEPVAVGATVEGLRPGETFFYRLAGNDRNAPQPELLGSETGSFATPAVPPRVSGEPVASFIGPNSAVMYGALNPENAHTRYAFQYGACENLDSNCPGRLDTASGESAQYGKIGATFGAAGLQPETVYRYRLVAESENGAKTEKFEAKGPEGSFTTAPAPKVHALTGPASLLTATSAVVSGTVEPDGKPAAYTFELGVDNGTATQYGVVFSGPVPASAVPVAESLALTGLQPGTGYAYRIVVSSGYGTAIGAMGAFTTAGLPAVLLTPTPLVLLATPNISFPKPQATPRVGKAKTKRKTKKPKHRKPRRGAAKKSSAHRRWPGRGGK